MLDGIRGKVRNYVIGLAKRISGYNDLASENDGLRTRVNRLSSLFNVYKSRSIEAEKDREEAVLRYDKFKRRYEVIRERARDWLRQRNKARHNLDVNVQASEYFVRRAEEAESRYSALEVYCLEMFTDSVRNSKSGRVLLDNTPEIVAVSQTVENAFGSYKRKDRVIPLDSRKALNAINSDQIKNKVGVRFAEGITTVDDVRVYPIAYVSPNNEVIRLGTLVEFDVKTIRKLRRRAKKEGKDLLTLLNIHNLLKRADKLIRGEDSEPGII